MATITVTGLTDEVLQGIERKAAANNRSVADEVRHILQRAVGPDRSLRPVRVQKIFDSIEPLLEKQRERQRAARVPDKPGWMIIREDRDSDHGRLYDPWGRDDSRN